MNKVSLIIVTIIFIVGVAVVYHYNRNREEDSKKQLHNDVTFTGKIVNLRISRNHNFGILYLAVDSASKTRFKRETNSRKLFPYLIIGSKAEVYTRIPNGVKVNDLIRVDSNKETIYYYDSSGKQKTEEFIYVIDDSDDVEFIKDNAKMR